MFTEIKILHSSCCATRSPIKEQIERVASKKNVSVTITELSELKDTMAYGTLTFPALVINGKVYDYKKYQTDEQLESIL
ncbi:thioredoxin family protein [Algoriphagus boritolerans]|uniref:Thioredoxin domain-containing protein n=1 Tax=Algoriphagus boritolerans DSM 17298 = JCM 18970 TaxID=1120964 RepID=A0A1H6APN8_9BACT|nr:thioredoxin family protein [Algoriphagus boritolerans]SEG50709.1 Thioredoxin domain-containing protein [Algoriphagus boritolerans DSM 17298 = JCM 18970]